jgi:hypothetical protein
MSDAVLEHMLAHPFSFAECDKLPGLLNGLNALTRHHAERCQPYRAILDVLYNGCTSAEQSTLVPPLPVRLFKLMTLRSVEEPDVVRQLTSSGTTGQAVSKIYLDAETARLQVRALAAIVGNWLGARRRPMIIIDQKSTLSSRSVFSARAAGVLGFANFGSRHHYLLDDKMRPDWNALRAWLSVVGEQPVLLFGFTSMVWQFFVQAAHSAGVSFAFPSGSLLIHGGGWKKLHDQRVNNSCFKEALDENFAIRQVANYYGMVEQVGSIFMECEHGHLHAPAFAEVIVRNPNTLQPLPAGATGVLQVLSLLPRSYPGHSLLTEDVGAVLGTDNCPCGRLGRFFRVEGRLPKAELRGCSDVRRV